MTSALHPTPAPNVEFELAKLANDAMQNGADPHDTTQKLHQTIAYLRQFPKMAEHATNALADGIASPADITRTLWPHVRAMSHATGSNAPTDAEAERLPADESARGRFGGGLASFVSGIPGGEALTTAAHAAINREPWDASLKDVRTAEASSPIRTPLKIAGAGLTFATLPGTNMAKGAIYGGLQGYTDPEPDADRQSEVIQNAIVGGGLGLGADVVGAIGSKAVSTGGKWLTNQSAKEQELAGAISRSPIGRAVSDKAGMLRDFVRSRPARGVPPPTSTPTAPAAASAPPAAPAAPAAQPSFDELLQSLAGKLRAEQPGEIGNEIGDAELAMQPKTPPADLEELLRRSLAAKPLPVAPRSP